MYPDFSYLFKTTHPALVDGHLSFVKVYGLCLFLAIYSGVKLFEWNYCVLLPDAPVSLNKRKVRYMFLLAVISGIIGSKVIVLFEYPKEITFSNFTDVLFKETGIAFIGGLLGGMIAIFTLFYRFGFNLKQTSDITVPSIFLGAGTGRLGCHLSGDGCWGKPYFEGLLNKYLPASFQSCDYPNNIVNKGKWIEGCTYKHNLILPEPVFPTSLYESIFYFCCVIAFQFFLRNNIHVIGSGKVFACFFLIYGLFRFNIEFIRVNLQHQIFGHPLSQAQVISLIMIVLSMVFLLDKLIRNPSKELDAT